MKIAAIDIGGTAIKSGLWDGISITENKEWPTNAGLGGVYLMERVKEILHGYSEIDAIGISTAGEVDEESGSIVYANSNIPGYTGMPVRQILEKEFHVPVAVENDVNAAALGELYHGAGRGRKDFLCVTYGTGVGGCIVISGKVYRGASHCAGGFGGIIIHPEQRVGIRENKGSGGGSGNNSTRETLKENSAEGQPDRLAGCYERCASTSALVHRMQRIDASLDDGRKIFDAMEREEVRSEVDHWIDDICVGLVDLISVFNPPLLILGGGVMAQEYVLSEVRRRVRNQLSPVLQNVQIVRAELGNAAGMIGAACLVRENTHT